MPETTKTYANIEILQGADYQMTLTLDSPTTNKSYLMTIRKDFTGATSFGGMNGGDGSSSSAYRTEIYETDDTSYGKLTASDSGTTYTVVIKLYGVWTSSLDDGFDGKWEMIEEDTSTSPDSFTRIAQGDIYVNNTTTRHASIIARSD